MSSKVVVTGLGAMSPLGLGAKENWDAAVAGRSGIGPITCFDPEPLGIKTRIAGEVKGFDPANYMDPKDAKRMDRFSQLALAAAVEAMEQSGLTIDEKNCWDVGTIIATGIGGVSTLVGQSQVLEKSGSRRVNPFTVPMLMSNAASGVISIRFGSQGPCMSVSSACASSTDAIGIALDLIRAGRVRAVIAGGVDAAVYPISISGFEQAHALCSTSNDAPEKASRPFDLNRSGFVLSEGGAVLILEDEEHARERGATVICELVGYGSTADSYHITAPAEDGHGAIRAVEIALANGGIAKDEVAYINAHGTSTQLNDKIESLAIRSVFGSRADAIPVSSTKSMTGHLGGAAGALEAFFCAMAASHRVAPPTINYETPDPECDLDYVPNTARSIGPGAILSNSFGFGGHCACLAFR